MKVLFCKISYMKYYKGVDNDPAFNGGKYVVENGFGYEEYNFLPLETEGVEHCYGFVETKNTVKGKSNQLHIEKINGCKAFDKEDYVEDVLVIWCATSDTNDTSIVGWYKDATVYRYYEPIDISFPDKTENRVFNIKAKAENCVLLPHQVRRKAIWDAAVAKKRTFGFGQSLVWYANEEKAKNYVKEITERILSYDGENWLYEHA